EALRPDPGTEEDFVIWNNPFAFTPGQMSKLLNPKSYQAFSALGKVDGLARGLLSDTKVGLSVDETCMSSSVAFDNGVKYRTPVSFLADQPRNGSAEPFEDRIRVFGKNTIPPMRAEPLLRNHFVLFSGRLWFPSAIVAIVALGLAVDAYLRTDHSNSRTLSVHWDDKVTICASLIVIALFSSASIVYLARVLTKVTKESQSRSVKVIRSGKLTHISVSDIVVGDVLTLEPGDFVPVDGICIETFNLILDEPSMTGDSVPKFKTSGLEAQTSAFYERQEAREQDPFIISGSKV
ncbi:hypothetical protein B0I35DRAFT_333590, partial [Stachybotrys elegans]